MAHLKQILLLLQLFQLCTKSCSKHWRFPGEKTGGSPFNGNRIRYFISKRPTSDPNRSKTIGVIKSTSFSLKVSDEFWHPVVSSLLPVSCLSSIRTWCFILLKTTSRSLNSFRIIGSKSSSSSSFDVTSARSCWMCRKSSNLFSLKGLFFVNRSKSRSQTVKLEDHLNLK